MLSAGHPRVYAHMLSLSLRRPAHVRPGSVPCLRLGAGSAPDLSHTCLARQTGNTPVALKGGRRPERMRKEVASRQLPAKS